MKHRSSSKSFSSQQKKKETATHPTLYQKLGSRWYVFSLIQEELYYGTLDPSLETAWENSPQEVAQHSEPSQSLKD